MHSHYKFDFDRTNMRRQGQGELWFAFDESGLPELRLRGAAHSPRFGDGEITVVANSRRKTMYALFKLDELHEAQCVSYEYPQLSEFKGRLERLRARRDQVMKWQESEHRDRDKLSVQWTRSYSLEFIFGAQGREVRGIDMKRGDRVVKTVRLVGATKAKGWRMSNEHRVCSDVEGKRHFHGTHVSLRECQHLCLANPNCGAVYGSMLNKTGKCWTFGGTCEEAFSPTAYRVWHREAPDEGVAAAAADKQDDFKPFEPPDAKCRKASMVKDPLAKVELRPPHQKSSALNDMLLLMAAYSEESGGVWPKLFLLLMACTVPGDVAVLIEDPVPPHPENLKGVSFDYKVQMMRLGGDVSFNDPAPDISGHVDHSSDGSIWLSLDKRAFRLRDYQRETKVGPVVVDLWARGSPDAGGKPVLHAHVNLTVQDEQQCITYGYPTKQGTDQHSLESAAKQGLTFFSVSEIDGEDCGIFVAPLARERWIHIWVDMESDNPDQILRTEVRRGGQILRRADILHWHPAKDADQESLAPPKGWACTRNPLEEQLAHFGLKDVEAWNVELLDALHALHELERSFAVLEVLALAGDVNLMVEEPGLPELWRRPAVAFGFSVYLWSTAEMPDGKPSFARDGGDRPLPRPGHSVVDGSFIADQRLGWLALKATVMEDRATNVSLKMGPRSISVRVEEAGREARCLSVGTGNEVKHPIRNSDDDSGSRVSDGNFDGVENIGDMRCNRFTFPGSGAHNESVKFWYSEQEDAMCQLEMMPPIAKDGKDGTGTGALIYTPVWQHIFNKDNYKYVMAEANFPDARLHEPGPDDGLKHAAPEDWHCETAASQEHPWLEISEEGAKPYALSVHDKVCAKSQELMRWSGPTAQSLHGCYEACTTRPHCEYFAFRKDHHCRIYSSPCSTEDAPGTDVYVRHNAGSLLAAHALSKLAEACGAVGMLPSGAASVLTRMVVVPPSSRESGAAVPAPPPTTQSPPRPSVSILSPHLRHFSFSFTSRLQWSELGSSVSPSVSDNSKSSRAPGSLQPHGSGELRVDLDGRRLYLRSEVRDLSLGIPYAVSEVVYRGDRNRIWVRTRTDNDGYRKCFSLKASRSSAGRPRNPFATGQQASSQSMWFEIAVPGISMQRVAFYVDAATDGLEALRIDDLDRRASTTVQVSKWSTDAPDDDWFKRPSSSWGCQDMQFIEESHQLAHWHLINVFFPPDVPRLESTEDRRLFEV